MVFNYLFSFFPLLLLLNCVFLILFKKWLGSVGIFYSSIFTIFCCFFLAFGDLYINLTNNTYYYIDLGSWIKIYNIVDSHLIFCFDNLSILLSMVVLFLTSLAQVFGVEYMSREAFISRLVYLLNLFATSVILLFVVYDFFLILIMWELIGLFSFLLVNYYSQRIYTIKASLKTFIFSRISDMFIFLAYVLNMLVVGSSDLSIIFIKTPFLLFNYVFINNFAIHYIFLFTLLLSLAGSIKGAQFFFHVWLPDAMEAPTPASALIHSSTLVIMGIYVIVRFSIMFEFCFLINYILALLGGITIAFGAVTASFQNDIKKLVAFSTISQMGYLVCGCGFCAYEETIVYLIMHAVNKAFLFIIVGYTVHYFSGNTDLRQIGSSYIYSLDICIFFLTLSFNLMGLPYSSGFFSKEFLLFQVLRDGFLSFSVRMCWVISFIFTPFYMLKLTFYVLFGPVKKVSFVLKSIIKNNINILYFFNFKNTLIQFFQHSLFLSRTTNIILFFFWLILCFSGEYFFLMFFNFFSLNDSIESLFFFNIKYNFSYFDINGNYNLIGLLSSFIYLITTNSFMLLISYKLPTSKNSIIKLKNWNSGFLVLTLIILVLF